MVEEVKGWLGKVRRRHLTIQFIVLNLREVGKDPKGDSTPDEGTMIKLSQVKDSWKVEGHPKGSSPPS